MNLFKVEAIFFKVFPDLPKCSRTVIGVVFFLFWGLTPAISKTYANTKSIDGTLKKEKARSSISNKAIQAVSEAIPEMDWHRVMSSAAVEISADVVSGASGTQVVVPIRVKNFSNIITVQGTIGFNPAILSFVGFEQLGLPGANISNFGSNQANSGILTFSWDDNTLNGVSIADNAVVFAVRFTITGSAGTSSPVSFSSTPTTLEFTDKFFTTLPFIVNAGAVNTTGALNTNWSGANSSDWFTAANWTAGIPAPGANVVIPAGASNYPEINSGALVQVNNLTLSPNAWLLLKGGTLAIEGDFYNDGTFLATSGTVSFAGPVMQTISGSNPVSFYDLEISSAGANLAGPASVQHLLTLEGDITTNGNTFTLLSNAGGTAMVVNNGGVINGTVTMQRYITQGNSGLGYRHYTSPVANTTFADLATAGYIPVVNPAFNTAANPGGVRPYPTIFQYNQNRLVSGTPATEDFGFGWESPAALTDPLVPGKGYTVNVAAPQTVDFTGTLNNGTITLNNLNRGLTTNSGWHLIGNPYPAPIDWNLVTIPAGMDDAIYAFRSSSAYNGSYDSYIRGIGTGSLVGGIIPSMQAFFVRTTANVASFSFENTARLTSYVNPAFYRSAETRPLIQLSLKNAQNQQDDAFVYLEQGATAAMDAAFDALELPMGEIKVYTLAGTEPLSINGLAPTANHQQIPVVIEGISGNYTLKAEQFLNLQAYDVILEDKQLNVLQPLQANTIYAFTHTGWLANNRFVLHLNAKINGMAKAEKSIEMLIYPNPTQGNINLQLAGLKAKSVEITVSDLAGKLVLQKQLKTVNGSLKESFDLNAAKGVYLLQINTGGQITTRKIVIE